jgi:hypothetical protein
MPAEPAAPAVRREAEEEWSGGRKAVASHLGQFGPPPRQKRFDTAKIADIRNYISTSFCTAMPARVPNMAPPRDGTGLRGS